MSGGQAENSKFRWYLNNFKQIQTFGINKF